MMNCCWVMVGYRFGVVSGYFGCESDAKSSYNVELMFAASFDSKMGCLYSVLMPRNRGNRLGWSERGIGSSGEHVDAWLHGRKKGMRNDAMGSWHV
ncbi:hypothetical protein V6N11_010587 [Hibiscus sabdariffa]|uniref:Uncharacterized protein n=1 Tax=Hibiscus sabdariffa TaxID=183260 RepID=A0ABR2S5V6_9ROSI